MKLELQQQDATEVYASDSGYVCIRQSTGLDEPNSLVCIRPDDISKLIRHLRTARDVAIRYMEDHNNQSKTISELHSGVNHRH